MALPYRQWPLQKAKKMHGEKIYLQNLNLIQSKYLVADADADADSSTHIFVSAGVKKGADSYRRRQRLY